MFRGFSRSKFAQWRDLHHVSMPQRLALGFLLLVLLGAFLLMLPFSSHGTGNATFINAAFTAVSAVTVTGLTVVDTSTYWTPFGQFIIMILMEVGALSFMSMTLLMFVVTRRKLDLQNKILLQETYGLQNLSDTKNVFRYVILLSVSLQLIGTILLAPTFIADAGLQRGLFNAAFHAVSAFGNAGFSTLPRQLGEYKNNPVVMLTISFLLLAGSLGFLVWRDVLLLRTSTKMTLHTRLTLWSTGFLLVIPMLLILPLNYHKIFAGQSWFDMFTQDLFMATSYRVGGFQPFDVSQLSTATIFLVIILVFIGGAPGSTAGGLKTTALAVLVLQLHAAFHGREDVNIFGRRLSRENVQRALLLFFVMVTFIVMITFVLTISENPVSPYGTLSILFEVISALATNGLSLGLTPELSTFGKIVIMLTMFIGRVGIYTAMFALLNARDENAVTRYPEETVIIG